MSYRKLTVVVSHDQAEMLAIQAAEAGESLSAFLRGRIFARDQWEEEFIGLRSTLLAAIGEGLRGVSSPALTAASAGLGDARLLGLLAETVMLLRGMNAPTKVQAVRAEVERLGLMPFGSKT